MSKHFWLSVVTRPAPVGHPLATQMDPNSAGDAGSVCLVSGYMRRAKMGKTKKETKVNLRGK